MHLVWLLAFAGSSLGRTALAPRSGTGSSAPLKLPGDRVMIAITIICSPVDADGCAIPYPPNEFCMPPHTSCKQDYTYVFNADVPQDKADECRRLCGCSPISNVMRYVCASSLIAVSLAAFNGPRGYVTGHVELMTAASRRWTVIVPRTRTGDHRGGRRWGGGRRGTATMGSARSPARTARRATRRQ